MAKTLTPAQKRCEDCACLVIDKDKKWCCDECFGAPIEEIDDCPEGFTLEEVTEMCDKKIKVNVGARADTPTDKPKRVRTVKISDEKHDLFSALKDFLSVSYGDVTVVKENKLMSLTINDVNFKIDLIETRKPKAK